jgi:hypothetical protein
MVRHSIFLITLLLLAALKTYPASAEESLLPSHCKPNEYAYLNARMGNASKTRKVLSVCADKATEPFDKLVYRYGAIGKVELEQVATPARPFQIYTRSPVPRVGHNILFFTNHGYTYYVVEAFAMGSGISLMVFHKGKRIVDLFSGNERGVDYESGLLDLNFDQASSPVLIKKAPIHNFK